MGQPHGRTASGAFGSGGGGRGGGGGSDDDDDFLFSLFVIVIIFRCDFASGGGFCAARPRAGGAGIFGR